MTYCTDVDLLDWEPHLPAEAAFASQTLIRGTGDLAGTSFTVVSGGSLLEARVQSEHVIRLSGAHTGSYPILSVQGASQLTLSVRHEQLDGPDPQPSPVGVAAGLTFSICTFWPQRRIVSELLLRCAGLEPSDVQARPQMLLNPVELRRACALGTLHMIYSALAAAGEDALACTARAEIYERLYRSALRQTSLELDLDADGRLDCRRDLAELRFVRR